MSRILSPVGTRESAILELKYVTSEVVAFPRVVLASKLTLPVMERVPVAVMLETLVMLPEMKALPWTERS